MKQNLFSYGTLRQQKVQLELFGRLLQGTSDTLPGYKTAPIIIEGNTYTIAVRSLNKTDRIAGSVLEVTEEELLIADKYESEDYKRVKALLESGKETWVYVAV